MARASAVVVDPVIGVFVVLLSFGIPKANQVLPAYVVGAAVSRTYVSDLINTLPWSLTR